MKKLTEDELIALNQRGYDEIANDFQASRSELWPELNYFSKLVQKGDRILDLGCAHGRLIKLFEQTTIDYHGLDLSRKLIESARQKNPEFAFKVGDARQLPYQNKLFDSVWLIALLHHLPDSAVLKVLKEAARVVKPGGRIVITVWHPDKINFWRKLGRRSFLRKWGDQSLLYYRFFRPRELKRLVLKSGVVVAEEGFLKRGRRCNYFIIAYRAPIA